MDGSPPGHEPALAGQLSLRQHCATVVSLRPASAGYRTPLAGEASLPYAQRVNIPQRTRGKPSGSSGDGPPATRLLSSLGIRVARAPRVRLGALRLKRHDRPMRLEGAG